MDDQVNPTGSLASGAAQALASAPRPRPTPVNPRPVKKDGTPAAKADGSRSGRPGDADLKEITGLLQRANSDLQFKVDKATGIPYFKVVSGATGEVIRQVPTEEVLAMAGRLRQMADPKASSGILVDQEG